MTLDTGYKLLHAFLETAGLGQYGDMFYEKGVTINNFHKLTEKELNRMRLTNSSLIKRLLQLSGRKENIKFKRMKLQAKQHKRDPMQRFHETARRAAAAGGVSVTAEGNDGDASGAESPRGGGGGCNHESARRGRREYDKNSHRRPTANQCVRQATTFIPPTPFKQSRIVEDYRNARYSKEADSKDTCAHVHGAQGSNCDICAELNQSSGVERSRKEMYPFPNPETQGPEYPAADYDFALQFRLLQLSIDLADVHQIVWDEEAATRVELYQFFKDTIEAALAAEREEVEDEENAAREAIDKEERKVYKEMMKAAICATVDSRQKYIDDLLAQQRRTLCDVELHERSCREAEEESEMLLLVETGAHLYHLMIKEQRDRLREIDAMDYRTRCPVCWKRKCTFHQNPWRLWSKRPTEKGFTPGGSDSQSAKIREDTIKTFAGRCRDAGVFADYEQFANQSKAMRPHIYRTKRSTRDPVARNKLASSLRKKLDSAKQADAAATAAAAAACTPAAAVTSPTANSSVYHTGHTTVGHATTTPPYRTVGGDTLVHTAMSSSRVYDADELGGSPAAMQVPRPPTPPGQAV